MSLNGMKDRFPIFSKNKGLIYLDSGATTQRPDSVIDAVTNYYTCDNASVHRGVYELSERATTNYEGARDKVAEFINASDRSEVIFTSGTTESINFIADTWGRDFVKSGDEIIVTQVEHHANLIPWQRLANRNDAKLSLMKINGNDFMIDESALDLISEKTKLISLVHSSNVVGNIWREGQLEKIIKKAHSVGAKVMLDCAQSIPHKKIDVQDIDADFVAFSAHKMLGPTGLGVLYIKKELHDEVEPYQVGGSMVYDASFEKSTWDKAPGKFEAGTTPISQVIGFGAAIDFFKENINFEELHKHESKLCSALVDGISSIKKVKIFGNPDLLRSSGHLVAFTVDGIHSHDVAAMLGMKNIAVRAGHHCVQPFSRMMGLDSTVRASLYMYNDMKDVEVFVKELAGIVKDFMD